MIDRAVSSVLTTAAWLLVSSPALATSPADDLRLGDDILPVSETLELTLDPTKPTYDGQARIEIDVKAATTAFTLHAQELELRRVTLASSDGEAVSLTHRAGPIGTLEIRTETPLQPGRHTLAIDFSNDLDTKGTSLYKLEAGGRSYTASHFQVDDARRAFPCWDEPRFKIPYQVTLRVPEGNVAVSNTPIERQTTDGGWTTVHFARTRPLPSYLLAIAAGPYESVPIPGLSVPGRVVTLQGKSALAAEAVRVIPPLLAALERYFGSPYPYEKLDFIALPGFWAVAMENPGAVTYDESRLLIDTSTARLAQRRDMASLITHELAHMWFGNMVTMEWWDDLWLNESFASWMALKIAHEVFPQLRLDLIDIPELKSAIEADADPGVRAVRKPVKASDNLDLLIDALTYKKGRAVLGMFERWVGPDAFRAGILQYLQSNRWGTTTAADLWTALSKASGKDVGAAMSTFLDQPGIPMVSVRLLADGRVELSQKRFAPLGTEMPPAQPWQIPLTFKISEHGRVRTATFLLTQPKEVMDLHLSGQPDWILPNADQGGYYHWQLPSDLLSALAARATAELSPRERLGLLGNLSVLVEAGVLGADEYLRSLTSFAEDPEPQIVSSVVGALSSVDSVLISDELEEDFAVYVRQTLGPALQRFGLTKKPQEDETVTALRPLLFLWLADQGKDTAVLSHVEGLARSYLADPGSVDSALTDRVLTIASIRGDRALFDEYRKRFETVTTPVERRQYLQAMATFTDPALVDEALQYILTGPLQPQEIFVIPRRMGNSPRLMNWITSNYEALKARVPAQQLAYLPLYASGCSAELLATTRAFFSQPEHQVPGTEGQLARTANQVNECIKLRQREGPAVSAYLREVAGRPIRSAAPPPG